MNIEFKRFNQELSKISPLKDTPDNKTEDDFILLPNDLVKLIKTSLYLNERILRQNQENTSFWEHLFKGFHRTVWTNLKSQLTHADINCHETALRYLEENYKKVSLNIDKYQIKKTISDVFPEYPNKEYESLEDFQENLKQLILEKHQPYYGQIIANNIQPLHSFLAFQSEKGENWIFEKIGFSNNFQLTRIEDIYNQYNLDKFILENHLNSYWLNIVGVSKARQKVQSFFN